MSSQDAPPKPPAPRIDEDSAFYWEGLREHRLLVQECAACERRRFPPTPACPYCAFPDFVVREVPGTGVVYSWIVAHMAFDPAFADDVPFTIATVDLHGGGRVAARVVADPATIKPGMELVAEYHDHDQWTELRFRPASV